MKTIVAAVGAVVYVTGFLLLWAGLRGVACTRVLDLGVSLPKGTKTPGLILNYGDQINHG